MISFDVIYREVGQRIMIVVFFISPRERSKNGHDLVVLWRAGRIERHGVEVGAKCIA